MIFEDPSALRELVGELGQHLKVAGKALGVRITQRGEQVDIRGQDRSVDLAADVMGQLYDVARTGYHLHPVDVDQACRMVAAEPEVRLVELYRDTISVGVGKTRVHPRSPRQRAYLHAIRDTDLVFGIGPAGTGKTFLAMAMALASLFRNEVSRIILCRPAVEAGEKLGFLPGDLTEKVNPYLRPLYDALHDLAGQDRSNRLITKGIVEVAPLAFMRGRTLSDAFVILDEAQNTTSAQMKMFLTRIGRGSRVVVTGDITQIDLPRGVRCGLIDALGILRSLEEIKIVEFSDVDVVRHPLVSAIVRAYAKAESRH
jgi:phosphate starvation-inducible PhoH-like protein